MHMRKLILILFTLAVCGIAPAQHLIGIPASQVKTGVKQYYKKFSLDESAINRTFKYLKFVEWNDDQTLLVFLNEKDTSTWTKFMSDYKYLDSELEKLNKQYRKTSENSWEYAVKGIKYEVKLEKGEWFFTLITKPKK